MRLCTLICIVWVLPFLPFQFVAGKRASERKLITFLALDKKRRHRLRHALVRVPAAGVIKVAEHSIQVPMPNSP